MDGHRTYPLRTVLFKGKPFKIILEAENGPSPLLAIANTLILKELIGLSASSDVITTSALQSLIATALRSAQIAHSSDPAESSRNIELSISRLHEFEQGLNLNLGFTRIDDYESSDRLVVFHTLGLEVVHGWLADPSEPASVVFQNDRLNSRTISEKRALGAGASAAEAYKLSLASGWLAMHSTQLTSFGLEQLRREIPSGSFRIFTRSNQYHCLYKHHENIFLLVTDPSVSSPAVWASPDPSHATVYYDAQFQALHGAPIFGTPPPKPNTSLLSPSPVDFSVPSSSSSSIPSPSASASVAGQPKKVIIIENILSKEVKTLRLPRWPTTYEALRRFVQSLFKELPPSFSVTYRDPDDDFISITTAAEFDEAIRLATDTGSNELQIRVVPSFSSVVMSQLPVLPEQPAVPTPLPSTLPATPDKPVIPTPQPITPTTTIPSPSPTPVPVPIPVTPITPSTPVSPQPPTSSSVPPPRPLNLPPKEETDISTLVPQWFVDQVCSIFDRGNRYSPSLIIESLIRNAANVEETVAELKASGAKTIGGRRPNSFRFSPDFTTSLQQILNFLPFNPYVCASALILKGGSIPEAVLELTTNLGQYENMLTPQERSYGTEAAARPEDSTPNLSTPQPSVPIPQPVPQPTPVLPSPPPVISPVLPSKPSPPPVSSPHPIPHIVPTEISSSYPLDDSSSEERRIQLLEEQARQEAIRIEEAERKLQQERAEYYRRIEEKKTLQSKHLRTKLAVVEASLSESSTELIAAKARHSEAMSRRTELQAELASTQRSRIEAERALEELRRLESELSGSLRSTDNFISTMSATVEQLSSKVESAAAQKAKLLSQIDSVNSAPTPSSPSASLSMAPVSSSLASFSLPTSFLTSLNLLEAQGFIDHALNFELLIKHAGNLDATINELLQRQSSH